jgi:hypothetical protein
MCKCTVVYINFYGMLRVALSIIQYYIYDSLFTEFIVEFIRLSNYSIYIRWHLPTEQHVILLACNEVVMYSFCLFLRERQQRLRSWSLMNSWSFIKFFEVFRNLPKFFEVSYKIGSHMESFEAPWIVLKKSKTFIIRLINRKFAEKINQLCGRIVFNAFILREI